MVLTLNQEEIQSAICYYLLKQKVVDYIEEEDVELSFIFPQGEDTDNNEEEPSGEVSIVAYCGGNMEVLLKDKDY